MQCKICFKMGYSKCVFEKDQFLALILNGKRYHCVFSQFFKNPQLLAGGINLISIQH